MKIRQWIGKFRRSARQDEQGRSIVGYRSIYILPTKQGMVLAIVLLAMLAGSINYGSNLAYLITFLLGGIWLTSILHTWRNLLGLRLTPIKATPVFAGQNAIFSLRLDNPSKLSRFGVFLSTKGGFGSECDLIAQQANELTINLPAVQRGQLILQDVSIHSRYPLGLFRAWTYALPNMHCLVYPRPAEQGDPPVTPTYSRSESGDLGMGADDFIGLRNFRYGDSPRHIDWKALARERGLFSKLFGGDRTDRISLDWDLLTDPDPERRLSQLCRFILLAHEYQFSYDLKLPGIAIPTGMDPVHRDRCLAALANFRISQ